MDGIGVAWRRGEQTLVDQACRLAILAVAFQSEAALYDCVVNAILEAIFLVGRQSRELLEMKLAMQVGELLKVHHM